MNKLNLLTLIILLSTFFTCKHPQQKELDLSQVRKIIDAQNAKWVIAIEYFNLDSLLSLYTDDAILLPPNSPMYRGKQQIKTYLERIPSRGIKVIKPTLTTYDLSGKDSTVYEIGQYIINIEKHGKLILSDTGKYTTIWKLQPDRSWRMYADCWNSNNPLRLMSSNK